MTFTIIRMIAIVFPHKEQKGKEEHVRQLVKRESLASRNFPLAEDQQCQWLFQTVSDALEEEFYPRRNLGDLCNTGWQLEDQTSCIFNE